MITGKTIWIDTQNEPDTYAEFIGTFSTVTGKKVWLNLACDEHYAVYVNDTLACFGESADYPWYRMYRKADITKFCKGENTIRIVVWYPGMDSQKHIRKNAGAAFTVEQNQKVLLESGSHILSRRAMNYRNGYCKQITSQMGFSFHYDNTVENTVSYHPSVEREPIQPLHLRKTGVMTLGKRVPTTCTACERGYLIDLGAETVGFLDLEFESPTEQEILIAYGEHLVDGQVLRIIAERDFSVEFRAKKGKNQYLNPFRRLAGRYLQVFCEEPLDITYIGLRPTDRRVAEQKRIFADGELQRIYDVSVNTLKKCMHEHYEDCPWREQAMYTLDSRNQMLCGYYAFRGAKYQRENLLLMTQGQREDGLLSLCFPAGIDFPIPFFSLVYPMIVEDYVKHTKDMSILSKVKPTIDRIMRAFHDRQDETGLISNFPHPCWNFYEWSEGSNHGIAEDTADVPSERQYDLILNCMYVCASRICQRLFGDCEEYCASVAMTERIHQTFYNEKKGLYRLSTKGELYGQLGNCFAILAGLGDRTLAEKIIHDENLIPVTLSMNTFYYDALLSVDEAYRTYVIADIRKKYGKMLDEGATTFWETEMGWQDFGGAGSLCHGWSALPVYYLSALCQ